jgi:hypothetical protein
MKCFLYSLLLLIFFGCKQDSTSSTGSSSERNAAVLPVEEHLIISNQKGRSDSMIQVYRVSAAGILDHRIKSIKTKTVTPLDKDMWHVEAVLKGSDMTFGDNLNGAWIDFSDNNTYKYGSYEVTRGGGKYHYDLENPLLLMLDDDARIKPQEFQTILNNDGLVLVGSQVYGDNNMQVKLLRKTVLPVKPAAPKLE